MHELCSELGKFQWCGGALITLGNKIVAHERFIVFVTLTFHAEFKYAIRIFPSPTVFVQ